MQGLDMTSGELINGARKECENPITCISQFTCSRIYRECVPHVEPLRGGRPRSVTLAQRQACARTITIGGLDNVVDSRNALSEELNVVVSTNTTRRVIYEASLGSLEKQKKLLLMANNVHCRLEFAQGHQDWTIYDWYRVTFSNETKIN